MFKEEKEHEGEKALKISREVAEEQFQSFFDFYFADIYDMEIENGVEIVKTVKNTIIRAIMAGHVSIDTEPELVITQKLIKPLISKSGELTEIIYLDKLGRAGIARDKAGKVGTECMNAFMGALSGIPATTFMKLKGGDMTIFTRISMLFSSV